MDGKVFVYILIAFLMFGCYKSADVPIKDAEASIYEEHGALNYRTKLASCKLTAGDLKGLSISGPKGEMGEMGYQGLPGQSGAVGPEGAPGQQGIPGEKGEPGRDGDKGQPGLQGKPGADGEPGAPGDDGIPGQKGEPGSIGLSGMPGLDGTCTQVCYPLVREPKRERPSDGITRGKGSYEDPLEGLCNIKYSEKYIFDETMWVNPDNPFQVRCNLTSHLTCLQTKPRKKYNGESAFYVDAIEPYWLSERNYNLTQFYGIPLHRISWLQQRATHVSQIIRYHCKNSYVNDQPETAIVFYGWNDLSIGPISNPNSPLTYTVDRNADECRSGAPKNEWRYSDILITSKNAKRLPVIDFRINDIRRKEKQSFYLELVELCFG